MSSATVSLKVREVSPAIDIAYDTAGKPREQLAQVLPDGHAIMVIHLAGGLSLDDEKAVASRIMDDVDTSALLGKPIVAGNSRLMSDITDNVTTDMARTGGVAVALTVLVLYLVFPVRRRLLALPVVLVGVLLTFGLAGVTGPSLTIITMAGLPILIGLGMDFAIQFHNRYEEESQAGNRPATGLITGLTHIGPAVTTAVLATILGFALLERFWEELARGATKQQAMHQAVTRVGRSISASALTL
jgi:predicted RND superfamily exporter protein